MLDNTLKRGFPEPKLEKSTDSRIQRDQNGTFIMSLAENSKVYFEDYYRFLRDTFTRATLEKNRVLEKLAATDPDQHETISFYRARVVIIDVLMRTICRFYCDGTNLGVVMTPWCFGTIVLEKVETYRDKIGRGEVQDPNIPEYPYYVIRYMDEIYKSTLLDLFDFPEQAFQMRWQYSELLKKYSKILNNITNSLQSVLTTIKNYGS